jgi:hypothetical protein
VDFDELVTALSALQGRTVRLQLGTPGNETVALETTGPLHAEDGGDGWAVFTLAGAEVRINLSQAEFTEAESSLDGSGSLRFLSSGVEFYVVPANRR